MIRDMDVKKKLGAVVVGVTLAAATVASLGAGASPAIAKAPAAAVKQETQYDRLNTTQIANFALAYCINVQKKGAVTTARLFAEVVKQDAISPAQALLILDSASAC